MSTDRRDEQPIPESFADIVEFQTDGPGIVAPLRSPGRVGYVSGLQSIGPFSLTGYWDTAATGPVLDGINPRQFRFHTRSFELLGGQFCPGYFEYRGVIDAVDTTNVGDDRAVSVEIRPLEPGAVIRAEWWRRTVFHLAWPVVSVWRKLRPADEEEDVTS